MRDGWVVGAYAASPTRFGWDEPAEREFLEGIYRQPDVTALEVPFIESLHKFDEDWFLAGYPENMDLVITLIGGTTASVKKNPVWGISSDDPSGRSAAIALLSQAHQALKRAHDKLGRAAVAAVQIQSAPGGQGASAASLARSLEEIHQWDWEGALITIEHCDALVPGQPAQKGYLAIEDEITAIERSSTPTYLTINWGRSAIESRSIEGPISHLDKAGRFLGGLMFSGAADRENLCGKAWADNHIPPSPPSQEGSISGLDGAGCWESASLMGDGEMKAALQHARQAHYLGLKINPHPDATIQDRIQVIRSSLDRLAIAKDH